MYKDLYSEICKYFGRMGSLIDIMKHKFFSVKSQWLTQCSVALVFFYHCIDLCSLLYWCCFYHCIDLFSCKAASLFTI